MEKLKIKLSIANRIYPLTIDPSQEEGLRKAALDINMMIKQLFFVLISISVVGSPLTVNC